MRPIIGLNARPCKPGLRRGLMLGLLLGSELGLSACQMTLPDATILGAPATVGQPVAAPREVRLSTNGLAVAGPQGFCVDPGSIKDTKAGSFVLLASCQALSGTNQNTARGHKANTAVLTLSISAPLADSTDFEPDRVKAYFASDAGRATLSRSGKSSTVTLLDVTVEGGAVFVHARDSSAPMIRGLNDEYWRAFLVTSGRLMTATATPFSEAPVSSSSLKSTLKQFAVVLARKNPSNR